MKKVLISIAVTLGVLVTIASLCIFVDYLFPDDRASAEVSSADSVVRYNALPINDPHYWSYDETTSGASVVVDEFEHSYYSLFNEYCVMRLGRSGQSTATLQDNVLSSSVFSTGGQYAYIDFLISRTVLLSLIDQFNSHYGVSLSNQVTFTMNVEVTSAYYIGQIWGRNSTTGGANATVALDAVSTSGIRSLTLDLDTYNFSYYSFIVQTYGSLDILGLKVEVGDTFTGFVSNYYRTNGYEWGYRQGHIDGESTGYSQGYDIGYDQGQIDEQIRINNLYDGWSRSVSMVDLKSTDYWYQEGKITSPNGGMISYVQNQGVQLTSTQNGTIFQIAGDGIYAVYPGNFIYIFALGYSGSFNLGDVVVTRSVSVNDSENSEVYVYSAELDSSGLYISDPIRGASAGGSVSLTLKAGVSLIVSAYKTELGSTFTRFYQNDNMSNSQWQSGFSEGYSTGTIAGREEGYNDGYDIGYETATTDLSVTVYREGYAAGVEYYASIAEHGDWWDVLSALINIPITFIMSLVSFEVLGLNFGAILRTIILLSLFFYVARKLL